MSNRNMPSDNVVSNGGKEMCTEVKFNAMFNQYTPQIIVDNFGNLRGFIRNSDGSIWFIGQEIASMIGYRDPWPAIRDLVSNQYKIKINLSDLAGDSPVKSLPRGNQERTLISEQGLYELCTQSELKNPQIAEFKQWIYNTIVQMRQTGISMSDQMRQSIENANNMDELKRLALNQYQQLQEDRPKVAYYNRMMDDTEHTLPISMIAVELGTTPQELNNFLVNKGFHRRMGLSSNYIPRKEFIDMDLVKVRKKEHKDLDGNTIISDYTVGYTEKGREYIMNLYHNSLNPMINDTQMRSINQAQYQPVFNFFVTDASVIPQIVREVQPRQPMQYGGYNDCPIELVDRETRSRVPYEEYCRRYDKRYKK